MPSLRRREWLFRFILPNHNLGRQGNVGSLHWLPERHPTRVAPLLTPPEAALFLAWGSAKVRNGGGVGEVTPSSLSTQVCAGGRDASARAAERTIPGSNSALWARGPGPAAAAHSGQHSSCPAAALSLRRRSLRTKMQAGPLSSRRTPLTASLPGPPPRWLSRKGQGGEICPTGTQSYSPQALRAVPWTARGKRNPNRKRVRP